MKPAEITVTVKYLNLVREKAGVEQEEIRLPAGSSAGTLLKQLKNLHSKAFTEYLYKNDGTLKTHIRLVGLRDSRQFTKERLLSDGEEVYLFVATSGG